MHSNKVPYPNGYDLFFDEQHCMYTYVCDYTMFTMYERFHSSFGQRPEMGWQAMFAVAIFRAGKKLFVVKKNFFSPRLICILGVGDAKAKIRVTAATKPRHRAREQIIHTRSHH